MLKKEPNHTFTVRMPKTMAEEILKHSMQKGVSVNSYILGLLAADLNIDLILGTHTRRPKRRPLTEDLELHEL